MQQSEADLYRLIVSGERFYAEYFHVGYYGMGFPPDMQVWLTALSHSANASFRAIVSERARDLIRSRTHLPDREQNQQFVHRGVEFQRRDAFEVLISKRWPNAVIMNTTEPPGAEIRNSPGQRTLPALYVYMLGVHALLSEHLTHERSRDRRPANLCDQDGVSRRGARRAYAPADRTEQHPPLQVIRERRRLPLRPPRGPTKEQARQRVCGTLPPQSWNHRSVTATHTHVWR
jgi:hypothetical protein